MKIKLYRVENYMGEGPYRYNSGIPLRHTSTFNAPAPASPLFRAILKEKGWWKFAFLSLDELKDNFEINDSHESETYTHPISVYEVELEDMAILFDIDGNSRQVMFDSHYATMVERIDVTFTSHRIKGERYENVRQDLSDTWGYFCSTVASDVLKDMVV